MAFSWYPGKSSVTYTHSAEPLILQTKSGLKRALPELVQDTTPDCYLNPFLFNGHLQTGWTAKKYDGPQIHYKRRVFSAEDPAFAGHFAVDFVVEPPGDKAEEPLMEDPSGIGHLRFPPRTSYFTPKEFDHIASDDTKPVLITLHGLSGGSYEVYLRHVLELLVAQTADGEKAGGLTGGDWEALVVNSRGCAGSKITSSVLYNARATWDLRQTVKWCRKVWPNRPLFGIGYSLGANILANYLGEEGDKCLLSAAVIVSNPWALEISSKALQRSYIGMNVYSKAMGASLCKVFENHREELSKNSRLNLDNIRKVKYLHEFDREVQCTTWGYPTEGAYYRDASSADSVFGIAVPTLCLHARDDPIVCDEAVPYEEIKQNPYVVMCATSGGGHLGWFEWGGGRWHAKPTVNFLNAMAKDIDFSRIEVPEAAKQGPHDGQPSPFAFKPMRRKMDLAARED